jgi:hypothetical protein
MRVAVDALNKEIVLTRQRRVALVASAISGSTASFVTGSTKADSLSAIPPVQVTMTGAFFALRL